MRRLVLGLALLALCACFGGGPAGEPTEETDVVFFAERIQSFYSALEDLPLDSLLVYEDRYLRSYFENERAFADYYASLIGEVRDEPFRNGRADDVQIEEFRFEGAALARVDVTLSGRHVRRLRFWTIRVRRTDTWRQVEGIWLVTPSKL